MWRQFYNMVRVGAQGIYISMFDEYNEGNQIAKTAETPGDASRPTPGCSALDEDGTACSSDYYLRLTGDGGRMLKGQLALTATRPTAPVAGGGDTVPPTVPTALHVTGHSDTTVALAWNPATDNVGVTGYTVYRVNGSTLTPVATTAALAFTVTGLSPSTAYTFAVAALDAAGHVSGASAPVSQTTDAAASGNLALHKPTSESSHNQNYGSGNAVDGDQNSYWESVNSAFPQWWQVDLGGGYGLTRAVLKLPASWGARSQTLTVAGST